MGRSTRANNHSIHSTRAETSYIFHARIDKEVTTPPSILAPSFLRIGAMPQTTYLFCTHSNKIHNDHTTLSSPDGYVMIDL